MAKKAKSRRPPARRTGQRADRPAAKRTTRGAAKRPAGMTPGQIRTAAKRLGALRASLIDPAEVATGRWVRWKCRFGCGGYATSLVCPPQTPEPHETRKLLDEYRLAVLFEAPTGEAKRIAADLERELFLAGFYKAFGMGAGPCRLCDACAFDEGCRHPREARPSMEACGIDVYATARRQGFAIDVVRTRDDPQHYYGLVLID